MKHEQRKVQQDISIHTNLPCRLCGDTNGNYVLVCEVKHERPYEDGAIQTLA